MSYCKDAFSLLKMKMVCGKDCPIFKNCPRLILEDATDIAIEKAIKAMMKARGIRIPKYREVEDY